jgi:hypothetical protein
VSAEQDLRLKWSGPIGPDDIPTPQSDIRDVHYREPGPLDRDQQDTERPMYGRTLTAAAMALAVSLFPTPAAAQSGRPKLHVNPRWKECSFQIDPSLTQAAWRQFTEEAGLVVYFRPLADARPLGRGNFEISALKWKTGIDDADAAWNDTFVHPDSIHYLFEGSGQEIPGLMFRAGVSGRTDVAVYFTKSPGANYGFVGGQVQYNLLQNAGGWAAATRASFVSIYGPDDLNFAVYGVDLLASRRFEVARWAAVSPYAGVSTYLASAHEKTTAVSLDDENVIGVQGSVGISVQLSKARLGVEYNVAKVPSFSLKVGFGR